MREAARDVVSRGAASLFPAPPGGEWQRRRPLPYEEGTGRPLREGADFTSQAELGELVARGAGIVGGVRRWRDPALRPAGRRKPDRRAAGLRLAHATLDDLEMMTWTGALPDGASWSRHAWWRVQLWQTFWRERDVQIVRRAGRAAFWRD